YRRRQNLHLRQTRKDARALLARQKLTWEIGLTEESALSLARPAYAEEAIDRWSAPIVKGELICWANVYL
ncbi:MAG TPA: hypothetical protein PL027_09345, partial [Thermosynergistes sp.]|nr:hypothetical protein [Thermosynergistes sp.]